MKKEINRPMRYNKDVVDFESFSNIFDALTNTSGESLKMETRYKLLLMLQKTIDSWGVTLDTAAERVGISRLKLDNVLQCQLHKLALDELIMLAAVVKSVRVSMADNVD